MSKLEDEIRQSVLNPETYRSNSVSFNDCVINYLNKKRPSVNELCKIKVLSNYFEGKKVSEMSDTWNNFCEDKKSLSCGTINRYVSTINAIMNMAKTDLKIEPPNIKKQKINNTVVFLLKDDIREKLLSCYSKHALPIFTMLAYQGFREQECLQLLWEDIRLHDATIIIRTSKNGETRSVPMHKKVWWILARKWINEKCPVSGNVWTTKFGETYKDSRKEVGGSPIYSAHLNALRKLKKKFNIDLKMRVHDWRHDWAGRMVMAGNDLITVQRLGGWKCTSMVARYATFSSKHVSEAINKI